MNIQIELDELFDKIIKNYKNVSDKELTRLVELIDYKYSSNDLILSNLSSDQLIRCTDYILRATYELTKRKGIFDFTSKHYILSNLCKARLGIESSSRKQIFIEKNLSIVSEVEYKGTFIQFKFFIIDKRPILLMKHIYGYGSITNWVEKILKNIQDNYLIDIGFHLFADNISIYYKDIDIEGMQPNYDKVTFEENLKNPKWSTIDSDWFEEMWEVVEDDPTVLKEPFFLKSNQPYTAYKKVKEILNTAKSRIHIIDPYIDGALFSILEDINQDIKIQVITDRLQGNFQLLYEKFQIERGMIEVRKSKDNHDRYIIIDNKSVYLLGSSLNSLGNKTTTIVPIENESIRKNIIDYFDESWEKIIKI